MHAAHAMLSSAINPYASLYIHTLYLFPKTLFQSLLHKLYFNLSVTNSIPISPSSHWQDYPICIKESITLLFLTFNDSNEWGEIPSLYTNQKHIQLFFFPQIIPNVCTYRFTPVIPEVLPRTKDRQTFKIPIIIHQN